MTMESGGEGGGTIVGLGLLEHGNTLASIDPDHDFAIP